MLVNVAVEQKIDVKKLLREQGIANRGNLSRLKRVIRCAEEGEKLTVAFLGGSITQGSLASSQELCYASRVSNWLKERYGEAQFSFVNAGVGGTTSHFGVARVEEDVLSYDPDLVFVEFSVNDDATEFFEETYEGLLRKILSYGTNPAVVLIFNVRYDTGGNAQRYHAAMARYYDLPAVSMQSSIFPLVASGKLSARDITPDDLHPNDLGHEILAGMVTSFLEVAAEDQEEDAPYRMPTAPATVNAYEDARRYDNRDQGTFTGTFETDGHPKESVTDIFSRGFYASEEGKELSCKIYGSEIALQYRKSVRHPAPVAELVLDGDEAHPIVLDGNFDEDWGDCLFLQPVLVHGEEKEHDLRIRITQAGDAGIPFYFTAVIAS